MKSVTHNTLFLTGASIIQKALSFIYFTLLARTFTADQIGAYSYSLAFTTIFSIVVDGGLTPVLIRYTAQNPENARRLLQRILKIKLGLLVLSIFAMVSAVTLIDAAFQTRGLILAAALVMIIDTFNLSAYGTLRGHQNLAYESTGMIIAQCVSLTAVIATVSLHAPIYWAIIGLGAGSGANAIIALLGIRRLEKSVSEHVQVIATKEIIREAVPFALAGIFARGYSFLDLLILGSLTNFATAGSYSIANKLTFVFQFIPLALSASLYPTFSKMLAQKEVLELKKLWLTSERYLLFCLGAIGLILISLRADILGFFGKAHVDATTTLVILTFTLVFAFLSYPVGAALNAAGLQKFQTTAMGATLGINLILNIFLIKPFGSEGAAMSALIGNIVLFSVGAWYVNSKITSLPWSSLGKMFAGFLGASIIGGLFISLLSHALPLNISAHALMQIIAIGVKALAGGIIYLLALVIFKIITKEEIRMLVDRIKNRV